MLYPNPKNSQLTYAAAVLSDTPAPVDEDDKTVKTSNLSTTRPQLHRMVMKPRGGTGISFLKSDNSTRHPTRPVLRLSPLPTIPSPPQQPITPKRKEGTTSRVHQTRSSHSVPTKPTVGIPTSPIHQMQSTIGRPPAKAIKNRACSVSSTDKGHSIPTAHSIRTKAEAWRQLIVNEKIRDLPNASLLLNNQRINNIVHAISDSGATAHFLVEGSPAVNVKKAKYPLQITLPNGKIINSTHTCNLDIPWLPSKMTEAHIVPGLTHSSLISTRKFCDAGCKVVFDEDECRVYYKRALR